MTRPSVLLRRAVVLVVVMALWSPGVSTASSDAGPSDTTTPSIRWLAAGDSFSSGEGISGVTGDCAQASTAWAPKVKSTLESGKLLNITAFEFQACSGATIKPPPANPTSTNTWAQQRAGALDAGTGPYDLVTFTFGGNDLGFASRIIDCLGAGQLFTDRATFGPVAPVVTLIAHRCTFNRSDLLSEINAFQGVLETFFKDLLADEVVLAPGGQLVVAGYPRLFADPKDWPWYIQGYCWGIHSDDVTMINDGIVQLNAVIASAILATDPARIRYVNVNNYTSGFPAHGLCSKKGSWINRWTLGGDEEFSQLRPRYQGSFHPTQAGHDYYAKVVRSEIERLRFKPPVDDSLERMKEVDWLNTQYKGIRCEGTTSSLTFDVKDGAAVTVGGERASFGGSYGLRIEKIVSGDLTGDGQPEAVILLTCSPMPSNYSVHEVLVFTGGPRLLANLPMEEGLTSPDQFDPATLSVVSGRISAAANKRGPDQCRACGPPELQFLYEWKWNGQRFEETVRPSAPAKAANPVFTTTGEGRPLPPAVLAKARAIYDAAASRNFDRLGELGADSEQFTFDFGDPGGPGAAVAAWRASPMELLEMMRVLAEPVGLDSRSDPPLYVWPGSWINAAGDSPDAFGYRLGITINGRWDFFVAGD